ncbi:MAG: hypothetical protein A2186_00750 [Candidatus Levybacteria bacterium RIFOXYA1_FULL_41_10]|nr:MAG: hypothetical protein UT46_C0003G0034 [Candidatus Levybacteria bacterium GW2011_GWA1_39_34]KKR50719.1 MAG: hypothetical protein UT87_C0013G0011 [Candidatus Levybacteria bacterium GW2011_GWC1_40_19]KKR95319.1 MAG: hypothetical protein UU45_C0002G0031 [Candidatus Levybacteria bacterium GW2011_GWA2_41_15]OGH20250.1 MAG: hypothetical protein A2695_02125 [Candidatus Levybacteria bacterium RIFCSPHIGHO2_01_FULL_40_83]OGH25245.1 MAG: hypothetical protein A3D82_03115 [Candidatus Levybacteria bact
MAKILFFGYGANREKTRIVDILRASNLVGDDLKLDGGYGARVDGMILGIQDLEQIPEVARKSLLEVWGSNFRAYTVKPGTGQVAGVLWGLNEKQFQTLKEWEHDGVWRKFIEVEITTTDQHKLKAFTDKALDDSKVVQIVDGLNYESNLNMEGMKAPVKKENDEYRIKELQVIREKLAQVTSKS